MFYRGRFTTRPRRSLTNLLVVYDSSVGYHRALGRLAPGTTIARRPTDGHLWAVAGSRSTASAATDPHTGDNHPSAERSDTADDGSGTE